MPNHVIDLFNAWGKRFQKEKQKNTVEFLNPWKLKFGSDDNELDGGQVSETEILAHPELLENFPGMELEWDQVGTKLCPANAIPSYPELEAYEAEVDAGIIAPTSEAPSFVDGIVVEDPIGSPKWLYCV